LMVEAAVSKIFSQFRVISEDQLAAANFDGTGFTRLFHGCGRTPVGLYFGAACRTAVRA
jgi:hypothetical protein